MTGVSQRAMASPVSMFMLLLGYMLLSGRSTPRFFYHSVGEQEEFYHLMLISRC